MAKLEAKQVANIWKRICEIYDETRETNRPDVTMEKILYEIDMNGVLEAFSAITKYKKHDGRIYGNNRKEMEMIETDPLLEECSHNNPLVNTYKLDHIHTAHINNLITELLKVRCKV